MRELREVIGGDWGGARAGRISAAMGQCAGVGSSIGGDGAVRELRELREDIGGDGSVRELHEYRR